MKLLNLLAQIFGLILSIPVIIIPTLLLNGDKQIPQIEENICVEIPKNYKVVDKYSEFLIFESSFEISIIILEDDLEKMTEDIEDNDCKNGQWTEKEDGVYYFELSDEFQKNNIHFYDAKIDSGDKTLYYSVTYL
ncbi:hypothetical protein GF357_05330 [Candidatus Dojkabacteria bacterium]|nr:hypothetical protein [Candidatus Dojkabacteria bacterium]